MNVFNTINVNGNKGSENRCEMLWPGRCHREPRTCLDVEANVQQHERSSALIGKELPRYDMDVEALSKTKFLGKGHYMEKSDGYTFFWGERKAVRTYMVLLLPLIHQ